MNQCDKEFKFLEWQARAIERAESRGDFQTSRAIASTPYYVWQGRTSNK